MISSIQLINFKSIVDETILLKPLTLLTGINNTGKSTLIQAMRIFDNLINQKPCALDGHGPILGMKSIFTKDNIVSIYIKHGDGIARCCIDVTKSPPEPSFAGEVDGIVWNFNFLSANRYGPRPYLPIPIDNDKLSVGDNGEYVIDFLYKTEREHVPDSLQHPKSEGETVKHNVSAWIREISPGVIFKYDQLIKHDISFSTFDDFRSPNAGFGLSYTLPVIVMTLGLSSYFKNAIIAVENPEAHLHPSGQTQMGRLLTCAAASGAQIIAETHSEHVLDGVRLCVKNGTIDANDVAIYYFIKSDEGRTVIDEPTISPNGKLSHWPNGFCDQAMKNKTELAKR